MELELELTPFTVVAGLLVYFIFMVFLPACFGIGMGGRLLYVQTLSKCFEVIFGIQSRSVFVCRMNQTFRL